MLYFMKILFIFALSLFLILPKFSEAETCAQAASKENLVNLRYNYGTLGFDATKSTQEISAFCSDRAAGCFIHQSGIGSWHVQDKIINIGGEDCVIPTVFVSYDFSGAKIYITKDHNPCEARAVLRHELQHFTIWKTSREWFLKDLKKSLQQAAAERARPCAPRVRCSTGSARALSKLINKVERRWYKIEERNQNLLDAADHSAVHQVNYPVCAPYSLKVGLF